MITRMLYAFVDLILMSFILLLLFLLFAVVYLQHLFKKNNSKASGCSWPAHLQSLTKACPAGCSRFLIIILSSSWDRAVFESVFSVQQVLAEKQALHVLAEDQYDRNCLFTIRYLQNPVTLFIINVQRIGLMKCRFLLKFRLSNTSITTLGFQTDTLIIIRIVWLNG